MFSLNFLAVGDIHVVHVRSIHTYTHTYIHRYIHTYIHTYIYNTYIHTYLLHGTEVSNDSARKL